MVHSPAVSVVAKVVLILRLVAQGEPDGGTTAALAREAGLNRSTTHRLLHELQSAGMVDRVRETARWVVGPEMYLLGTAASPRYDIAFLAQPYVRELALTTGESAFFSVRRGDETVCLVREDGNFPLRSHVLYEGVRFPLGVASAGLAILAFMTSPEADRYIQENSLAAEFGALHAEEALRDRMRDARRTGYAVNPGLLVEGSWGMAAAVFDQGGSPVGALSLTGVEHRFAPSRQPQLGRLLLNAAHALTAALHGASHDARSKQEPVGNRYPRPAHR